MGEINARALMFSLAPEDATDSTTAAKIARYAERKHLAYNLTKEGAFRWTAPVGRYISRRVWSRCETHWVCTLYRNA